MTRFIFITGGVASSLGKGIASASIGALLQARGFSVRLRKYDPYINVDPGTMSPFRHGEVYVTEDGAETDLDLGHYERFTGVATRASDTLTTGRVYSTVIAKERRGDYLGSDVQVIPHVTDEIKRCMLADVDGADFVICEIGGTIGDIEGLPFIEAIRQLKNDLGQSRSANVHLTLLPYLSTAGELKTKPSQHSVRELLSVGIQPDFLICRSVSGFTSETRKKLALFCNVPQERVIDAPDAGCIYEIPLNFHKSGLDYEICRFFGFDAISSLPTLDKWQDVVERYRYPEDEINIGVFGKYANFVEAYKSLQEAITHGGLAHRCKVNVQWIDTEDQEKTQKALSEVQGIIVPGGFGNRGTDGKLDVIKYARENEIPFLGICLGMQLSVVEIARSLAGIDDACSAEFDNTSNQIIGLMTEWQKDDSVERRSSNGDLGGTMRLGAYPCHLAYGTNAWKAYGGMSVINERHRHRYEVEISYKEQLEKAGLIFSGMSPDGKLTEIVELKDHPWFVGVQFHPEFKSKPFDPHPLFVSFLEAARSYNRLV